jgi:hypothetical protein
MALIYLGYKALTRGKNKKGDDSEEVETPTIQSEMAPEKPSNKKKVSFSPFYLHNLE